MASQESRSHNLTPIRPLVCSSQDSIIDTPNQIHEINGFTSSEKGKCMDKYNHEDEDDEEFISSPTDKHPRRSFYYSSQFHKDDPEKQRILDELDRTELSITRNLQKINQNLLRANAIVSDKLLPTLDKFQINSNKIFRSVNHIKEFYENAANVNILTREDFEIHDSNDELKEGHVPIGNHTSAEGQKPNISSLLDASHGTSDISIKDRYKQNFSSNIEESTILGNPPLLQSPLAIRSNYNGGIEHSLSSANLSLLDSASININAQDESTAKNPVRKMSPEQYRKSITGDLQGSKDKDQEVEGNQAQEVELSPESRRNNYMSNLKKGYESPPWEEPPILESERFISPLKKKRKLILSPHRVIGEEEGVNDDNGDMTDIEEDISIRFPMSPKYGGGGKLLRSEKGRKLALQFARSELVANHPILSLQSKSQPKSKSTETNHNQDQEVNQEGVDIEEEITGTFYTLESNSTIDNPPQLTSGLSIRGKNSHFRNDSKTSENGNGEENVSDIVFNQRKDLAVPPVPSSAVSENAPPQTSNQSQCENQI